MTPPAQDLPPTESPGPDGSTQAVDSRPLTIGIDAAEAEGRGAGVGRYTQEIAERWIGAASPNRRYVVFARRREALPPGMVEGAEVVTSEREEGVVRWQQFRLPGLLKRRPVDVLFAPAYAIPIATRTRCVVALHDLSFERYPEEFRFRERWRRRVLARLAARRAARVLTISEFSAQEIHQLYRLPADRVTVSYPGVDRFRFRPHRPDPLRPARPFFLAVGTFLRRRHLDVLVQAFAKLPETFSGHELVLVGHDRAQPPLRLQEMATRLGVDARVRIVDHVADAELVNLYRTTALHVSLSAYEGFGLPAAEGLASGAPTLLLDQPLYRELWDGCAHFVDTPAPDEVARAMELASSTSPDQDRVQERLRNQFDWDRCARRIDEILAEVATEKTGHIGGVG